MNIVKATAAALGMTTLLATPIYAQNTDVNANNLVNVDLSNATVANDIAENLSINVEEVPVTIQVPVGVAANVCNVAANVLASDNKSGAAKCTAESSSQALAQAVKKQMASQ